MKEKGFGIKGVMAIPKMDFVQQDLGGFRPHGKLATAIVAFDGI